MEAIWHFLVTLFRYPDGIVFGNLLASVIWATPTMFTLHKKLDKHHKKVSDLHEKIDALHRKVDAKNG